MECLGEITLSSCFTLLIARINKQCIGLLSPEQVCILRLSEGGAARPWPRRIRGEEGGGRGRVVMPRGVCLPNGVHCPSLLRLSRLIIVQNYSHGLLLVPVITLLDSRALCCKIGLAFFALFATTTPSNDASGYVSNAEWHPLPLPRYL